MWTMNALRFERYGPPSVLSLQELPVPHLKAAEVLVELHASALNPSDVKNVAGAFKATLPRVPGRDYAGIVIAGDGQGGARCRDAGNLLRVTSSAICGTDLHFYEGRMRGIEGGVIGHEPFGVVEGVGSAVSSITKVGCHGHVRCT